MRGHDVFDDGPGYEPNEMNPTKSKHLRGHDVFDDAPDPSAKHSRFALNDLKLNNDLRGHNVFGNVATPKRPSTALSEAKKYEMYGRNIFAEGVDEGYAKNVAGEMQLSDARAAAVRGMQGNDIFSDGDGTNQKTTLQINAWKSQHSNVKF